MKRLLYIAFKDLSDPYLGGNTKVRAQCRAFSDYGFQVELMGRSGDQTVCIRSNGSTQVLGVHRFSTQNKRLNSILGKAFQIRDLIRDLSRQHYDACYIRYDFSDPMFLRLLRHLRPRCQKILLEIPTYPYEGENRYGLASRMRMVLDRLCRTRLHRYIDQIVTFYHGYPTLFRIPVLVVPNGFDFSSMALASAPLPEDGIHIAAVSSMREWHGYERIMEGLRRYYGSDIPEKRNFVVHLVGHGRLFHVYETLITRYHLEDHVFLEGALHGDALQAVYERCALGIDSLGRHRSDISRLSSLKSREYAAKGLPIINSCPIDVIEEDFPYLLLVPADETPLDFEVIGEFYDHCFHSGKSRQEVGQVIRGYMERTCNMKQTLLPVVEGLRT